MYNLLSLSIKQHSTVIIAGSECEIEEEQNYLVTVFPDMTTSYLLIFIKMLNMLYLKNCIFCFKFIAQCVCFPCFVVFSVQFIAKKKTKCIAINECSTSESVKKYKLINLMINIDNNYCMFIESQKINKSENYYEEAFIVLTLTFVRRFKKTWQL